MSPSLAFPQSRQIAGTVDEPEDENVFRRNVIDQAMAPHDQLADPRFPELRHDSSPLCKLGERVRRCKGIRHQGARVLLAVACDEFRGRSQIGKGDLGPALLAEPPGHSALGLFLANHPPGLRILQASLDLFAHVNVVLDVLQRGVIREPFEHPAHGFLGAGIRWAGNARALRHELRTVKREVRAAMSEWRRLLRSPEFAFAT